MWRVWKVPHRLLDLLVRLTGSYSYNSCSGVLGTPQPSLPYHTPWHSVQGVPLAELWLRVVVVGYACCIVDCYNLDIVRELEACGIWSSLHSIWGIWWCHTQVGWGDQVTGNIGCSRGWYLWTCIDGAAKPQMAIVAWVLLEWHDIRLFWVSLP